MSDFILTPAPGSRSTCAFGPFPDATAAEAYARENRLVGPTTARSRCAWSGNPSRCRKSRRG